MKIIKHNDKAYGVLRQVPMHHFANRIDTPPNGEYVNMFKEWCGADTIIQTDTHFMFCETIPDVDFETTE
jgi:hypothetical protein